MTSATRLSSDMGDLRAMLISYVRCNECEWVGECSARYIEACGQKFRWAEARDATWEARFNARRR